MIRGLWSLFTDFIGFLFDIDLGSKAKQQPESPFSNVPSLPAMRNEIHREINSEDENFLVNAFGAATADYINSTREEVDNMIQEYGFQQIDSILAVIPPQKLSSADIPPSLIDSMIQSIYNQFDGDIVLRPGKINMFVNSNGEKIAEMYIDCYRLSEEFIKS